MKKSLSIIAIIMCVVLAIPSIPVRASNVGYQLRTVESVEDFWNDTQLDNWQKYIVGFGSDYNGYLDSSRISLFYDALAGLTIQEGFSPYFVFIDTSGGLYCVVARTEYIVESCCVIEAETLNNYGTGTIQILLSGQGVQSGYDYTFGDYQCSFDGDSFEWSELHLNKGYLTPSDTYESDYFSNVLGLIYGDMYPFYLNADIIAQGDSAFHEYGTKLFLERDRSSYHNFMSPELPYTDPNGDTVYPGTIDDEESNENHMYLKSCDVGFCKPYSLTDLSSAGGGYLYVNYTYDNWINSHSSDYWVNIRTVVNVDGTQYSGINTRALDLNGINVITFKESTSSNNWTKEGLLFVEFPNTVVSTYKAGFVYNIPYPTFANTDTNGISNRSRFLGNGRNRLFLTPTGGRGYDITNQSLGDSLQSIFNVNVHQKFTVTVTVWLQDTNNNRSGDFTKSFNLITGVGTVLDTGITDNVDPFEPDPSLPDIPDGSGNDTNSVAPIVNNLTINGSGTIGYDPGYKELKEDIEQNPNGNFSQYLDPMHNDDVGSWFMSFVNDMPTEMKSILIAGVGVGVLFGLYRFIRRG